MNKAIADEMRAAPQSRVTSIDFLFDDFDRLIQSAESVRRLRRFVLDLAVRGKLVPQDPNDEPASELVKQIAVEKARLVKAGEIRKSRTAPEFGKDFPFDLPSGWAWIPFGLLHNLVRGVTYSKSDVAETHLADYVAILRANNIGPNLSLSHDAPVFVKRERVSPDQFLSSGDFMIALSSGSKNLVGKAAFVHEDFDEAFGGFCGAIRLFTPQVQDFVRVYLQSNLYRESISAGSRGIGINNLKKETLSNLALALPPLAEQRRIVAKVDELMARCDRLEAARAEREATRDRLARASLARFNTPDSDPERFQHDVVFALNNLTPLTTRPYQIKAFRQTILNLAVRGKLVPQDPKEDRSNQGQLRSDTTAETYDVGAFEVRSALFKRPDNWTIEPLSRVSSHIVDCLHTTPKWTDGGSLCIKTNQVRAGQLDLSSPHFVSENTYKARVNRLEPRQDDILYIREGGVLGVACLVPSNTRLCLGQRLMQIRANSAIAPQFLEHCLNSPWITELAAEKTTGGAAPRVNMSIVRSYPIPLPPLDEQHRIVSKVDELMALCDRLEASLTTGDDTLGRLIGALLHEALGRSRVVKQ